MNFKVFNSSQISKNILNGFVYANVIVINETYKDSFSLHVKINGEVWPIKFDKIIPTEYVYLNRDQRTRYQVAYNDTVTIEIFRQIEKLGIYYVNVHQIGRKSSRVPTEFLENATEFKESFLNSLIFDKHFPIEGQFYFFRFRNENYQLEITNKDIIESSENPEIILQKFNNEIICGDNSKYGDINDNGVFSGPLQSWNLREKGVGGLSSIASELFRRAFASRQNPKNALKLGIQHVKGVIMHGVPGCGKTKLARTIAELLNKRIPPKIVSGPEIFDKYVGGSSDRIRDLFKDAEADQFAYGNQSELHVIIFDEFDSVGRKRTGGDDVGSQVGNQVVNQLLAKMDGPDLERLNNILVIAMTNRIDLIDSALLRPGRFEIQIEVKLPTLKDRIEIFEIHCKTMIKNGILDSSVDFVKLGEISENFTGAEIEGVVKNASSYSLSRTIDIDTETQNITVKNEEDNLLIVTMDDFYKALREIKPQFGIQQNKIFTTFLEGIEPIPNIESTFTSTILIKTEISKRYLHEQIIGSTMKKTGITHLLCIDFFDLIGLNDLQVCNFIKEKYIDASKPEKSLILINHIDQILGSSEKIKQTLWVLIKYYSNVITIASYSSDLPNSIKEQFDTNIAI